MLRTRAMHGAWDRRMARRASAIAAITAAGALLVITATDDGAPWGARLATWGALLPIAGAVGAAAAVRLARARGELSALAALGTTPLRATIGAVAGGTLVALFGPGLAASRWADLGALFPRPVAARQWMPDGAGAMRELELGLRLAPGGILGRIDAAPGLQAAALPASGALAATLALVAGALVAPFWVAQEGPAARKVFVGALTTVALIVAFQSVAAGQVGPVVLVLPPLVPLIDRAVARR